MKVTFDATIDDFVDTNNRLLKRSKLIRKWRWVNVFVAFLITGAVFYFVFPGKPFMRIAGAIIVAAIAAALFPAIHRSEVNSKLKKYFREQLGTEGPIKIEVEISDACLAVKQLGTLISHDWPNISSVENTRDAVELIHRRGGITVVRSRAFNSPEEQEQFATLARHYIKMHGKEQGIL
jgi:hypothetical protein